MKKLYFVATLTTGTPDFVLETVSGEYGLNVGAYRKKSNAMAERNDYLEASGYDPDEVKVLTGEVKNGKVYITRNGRAWEVTDRMVISGEEIEGIELLD